MISATNQRLWCAGLLALALLEGCSGRTVMSSAGDQSLAERKGTSTQVGDSGSPTGAESARITEPAIASPVVPPGKRERLNQPSLSSPSADSSGPANALGPGDASALLTGTIGDVYFDFDRYSLRKDAKTMLEANARQLKLSNGVNVLIEGHCDERGTQAYNLVLGERRAQVVGQYLRELGIPPSQLQIISYGKERPFCTEHQESCWQQNRRGHFVVK